VLVGVSVRQMDAWGFPDRRNGLYELSSLPPGVLHVCDAEPHRSACYTCMEEDRCGWATWDGYKVKPGVALDGVGPACGTLSGLGGRLHRIVVEYLGRFCTSTHTRYINPAPLADFCNYCQERGHEFDLEECGRKVEGHIEAQHLAERYAREAERRTWRHLNDRGVKPCEDADIY